MPVKTGHLGPDTNPISRPGHRPEGGPSTDSVFTARENQAQTDVRDPRRNVEINIGHACNNRCVFCMDGLPKAEDRAYLRRDAALREIDLFAAAGHRSLGFLGGEPTTWRWLPDAIRHARAAGFTRISLCTNATRMRLPHYTETVISAGLTRVTVSMHAHTARLEDALTRVPGNFDKKVAALKLLVAARDAGRLPDGLSVNIVLNGWNARHLPRIVRFFFEQIGVDDVRANVMRPEGYAQGSRPLTAPFAAMVPPLLKTIALNEGHWHRVFTFGGFPLCVLPPALRDDHALLTRTMGERRDLSTDCSIRAESADGFGIQQVSDDGQRARFNWQESKRYDLKTAPSACGACARVRECEGVWNGYLTVHGDAEFRPL